MGRRTIGRTPTKPGKWDVMYLFVSGIDFASVYYFDIWFWNCFDSVVCFVFHFLHKVHMCSACLSNAKKAWSWSRQNVICYSYEILKTVYLCRHWTSNNHSLIHSLYWCLIAGVAQQWWCMIQLVFILNNFPSSLQGNQLVIYQQLWTIFVFINWQDNRTALYYIII